MDSRERCLCLVLFFFLVIAVFSTVSLFYLTALVYLPSIHELSAGIQAKSVKCTTLRRQEIPCETTEWTSCWEWCLSDATGKCTLIEVDVRNNGSNLDFDECTIFDDFTCPHYNEYQSNAYYCKGLDNYSCQNMTGGVHECEDGVCIDHTEIFDCSYNETDLGPVLDCRQARQCVEMTGMFNCTSGVCTQFHAPWNCSRRCPDFQLDGVNVIVLSGERTVTANCKASRVHGDGEGRDRVLPLPRAQEEAVRPVLLSCTHLFRLGPEGDYMLGEDCTNASSLLPGPDGRVSFYQLRYFASHRPSEEELTFPSLVPYEEEILLLQRGRLKINHQGCVNTLEYECTEFLRTHRHDGRNDTARSVFPCYISQEDQSFIYARYYPRETQHFFFMLFVIPVSIWCASCSCVYFINSTIIIDSSGKFTLGNPRSKYEKETDFIQVLETADSDANDTPLVVNL